MTRTLVFPALFFGALALLPLMTDDSYVRHIAIIALLYAVVVSGWNITLGFGGVFNFAHLALFAIAAYATGILTKTYDWPSWTGIPVGIGASVIAALVVCLPVLRLRGIYVILVTFGFGQLCFQFVLNQRELTGGNFGFVRIPPLKLFDYSFRSDGGIGYYYVALLLLLITVVLIHRFVHSPFGWRVMALRENEPYAVARGIALARVRLSTFAFSAIFPGAAGAVYAQYVRSASPDMFGFSFLTIALSMLLLGGVGTIWGPIVGALVFSVFSELMTPLGPGRYLVTAVVIVAILRFFPKGLSGIPEAWQTWRKRAHAGRDVAPQP
ncbi:branched-chain amino acid ABC transporter permease [Chachezhania antarctica]|uniref:branched-chain amino acid ABC transporter permease n=1 Tax=Chachezhania antarctica TaxID=2340860 RepID=UPI000EB512C5|nr:branched-chain amino acid ABC transporter permease [Chachezhania antarctica]|tara:strand:+ start:2093 stop:3067 length:975 start_codon:yes stop_codon:yes gene_type:complete